MTLDTGELIKFLKDARDVNWGSATPKEVFEELIEELENPRPPTHDMSTCADPNVCEAHGID